MTSVNPAPGRPQQVEKERSIEELPPMHHKEQPPMHHKEQLELTAAPHIDQERLKIIRQHLEEKSTK